MAVHTFFSTDAGAPTLSGAAGGILAMLRGILVNGYNTQTGVTVTRSGSVATFTKTGHGFREGQVLTHSGFDQADYNITARIYSVTANTWQVTVSGSPTTPGTGAGQAVVSPARFSGAAWTEEFSSGNDSVFRAPTGTKRHRFRFADGSTQVTNLRGFEVMSDVNTGTGPFPTVAQKASGVFVMKSSTTDSTVRPWYAFSNGKAVYVVIKYASTAAGSFFAFGEFLSEKTGDEYLSFVLGGTSTGIGNSTGLSAIVINSQAGIGTAECYAPRSFSQLGAAVTLSRLVDTVGGVFTQSGGQVAGSVGMPSPSPVNGGLYLSEMKLIEGATVNGPTYRGRLPGIWVPNHNLPLNDLEVWSGTGAFSGKTFMAQSVGTGPTGQFMFETSDTW